MKLRFRQRFFSWFDSYDIYNESGETVFAVKGALSWGHLLRIYDAAGRELGSVRERVLSFLPKFDLYLADRYVGCIRKEFTLFKPVFQLDFNGWRVDGNWLEWDYSILDAYGKRIASVSKELWNWTDTYVLDIAQPQDALCVLMVVLAIDAEKCSRDNN